MAVEQSPKRRHHGVELKATITCRVRGVRRVGREGREGRDVPRINANIGTGGPSLLSRGIDVAQHELMPAAIAPTPDAQAPNERIEVGLRRSALTMKIGSPLSAAADLVARTRELLR